MTNRTLDNWRAINAHLFWYRLFAVFLFFISSFLAFLFLAKMTEAPIVVVKDGEEKSYLAGERVPEEITEANVESFIVDFVRSRYTWQEFDPATIAAKLDCVGTEEFLKKLEESLGKKKHTNKEGQSVEQYAARIVPKLEKDTSFASFDRILRINGVPLATPSQVAVSIIREGPTACNPLGLYVDSLVEYGGGE